MKVSKDRVILAEFGYNGKILETFSRETGAFPLNLFGQEGVMQQKFFAFYAGKDPWKDFPTEWKAIYTHCPEYIDLKQQGKTESEIDAVLKKPGKRKVFSYDGGEKDNGSNGSPETNPETDATTE